MKYLSATILASSILALTACGSDSNDSSNKQSQNYSGYMPKFSTSYINNSPKELTSVTTESSGNTISYNSLSSETEEALTIEITPIDCSNSTETFNSAPQANNLSNTAIDFIRNIQAQTNSYDCIIRQQVFNHSADITEEGNSTIVSSSFIDDNHDNHSSWIIPTEFANKSSNSELNINARGTLLNIQPSDSNTRINLIQKNESNAFLKIIRTTVLHHSEPTTNITSSLIMEIKDKEGNLITQRIGGRITFDNKISVIASVVIPNVGAISYLKQCDESTAASSNDYMRECTGPWQVLAYDEQWSLLTDASAIGNILTTMTLTSEGTSVMDEVVFFFGESEEDFFSNKSIPPMI